jgi:CPA2 family monovalent cation:H+ antiporter-2
VEDIQILKDLAVVFGCAVPVVYLFHRLKQSPIVGFVVSGILIGPFGLSWIHDVESVKTLAVVGVMILLFSLGLEFSLKKLMETRVAVLATGPLQMAGTIIPVMIISHSLGASMSEGLVYGVLIGVSSTTVFMKVMAERGEVDSVHGRVGLGISIFQDLCAIPMMVLIPLLASGDGMLSPVALALAKALAIIVAAVVMARYIFPALLTGILHTRSKELFLITSVFVFLGTAWVTSSAGISLALGSFLAGLILSESEYGHQIFAEVRPVRDSLNSLFFISTGMLVDPRFIGANAAAILGISAAIVVGKTVITAGAVRATGYPLQVGILVGTILGQIGEFSFILLQAAASAGILGTSHFQMILASSLATMGLSPLVFSFTRKLMSRSNWQAAGQIDAISPAESLSERAVRDHVIICGFGLSGRNIAGVLKANSTPYIILDLNAQAVGEARKNGEPIYFGDCTSTHMLMTVGIRRARVIVFVLSDPFAARRAIRAARELNREIVILTRTKRVSDMDELWDQGSTEVIAEEFEATLELTTRILRVYNAPRAMVAAEIKSIRDQRFGIFRERHTTVPRIRLSGDLDVYTETWEVPKDCTWHGTTVSDTQLRGETGVLILGIIRGRETLNNPPSNEQIYCGDRLVLTGTKEQLEKAIEILKAGKP